MLHGVPAAGCHFAGPYAIEARYFSEETTVKEGIHPEYVETTIRCACGAEIPTRSTKKDIHVEICSKCHPFFTGTQKLIDSAGRIDRFRKKYAKNTEQAAKK